MLWRFLDWQLQAIMSKKSAALRVGASESGRLVERPNQYTVIVSGFGGKVNE